MPIVKSKMRICEMLGIEWARLDHLYKCGAKRPENFGSDRSPQYNITAEYLQYLTEFNKNAKKYSLKDSMSKNIKSSTGANFCKYLEDRIK